MCVALILCAIFGIPGLLYVLPRLENCGPPCPPQRKGVCSWLDYLVAEIGGDEARLLVASPTWQEGPWLWLIRHELERAQTAGDYYRFDSAMAGLLAQYRARVATAAIPPAPATASEPAPLLVTARA